MVKELLKPFCASCGKEVDRITPRISILYTLSDLGVSSNLNGSLSQIMTLYSPPNAENI